MQHMFNESFREDLSESLEDCRKDFPDVAVELLKNSNEENKSIEEQPKQFLGDSVRGAQTPSIFSHLFKKETGEIREFSASPI